jgi:GINS complex subunit 2
MAFIVEDAKRRWMSSLEEAEFASLDEEVRIVPNFRADEQFEFLTISFGPLAAGVETTAPLWLALELHRLSRCSIKRPDWLCAGEMRKKLEEELKIPVEAKDADDESPRFAAMPTYYLEHAAIFLNDLAKKNRQSAGDFSEDTEIRELIQSFVEKRRVKVSQLLEKQLTFDLLATDVTNLSNVELQCLRAQSLVHLDSMMRMLGNTGDA